MRNQVSNRIRWGIREALSNNPVRSGVDFDLLEVSSLSVDRVPLDPDSVDSR